MLTRFKVSGFKNLIDTEIFFGPFTCIAGQNGVGKSNIFDAIQFLSLLADNTFVEAARHTRGGEGIERLFTAGGDGLMTFNCDLIVPKSGLDDFMQEAKASVTFLNYSLKLRLDEGPSGLPRVELVEENLSYIPRGRAKSLLGFETTPAWRDSVIIPSNRRAPLISTDNKREQRVVRLSADKMKNTQKSKRGGGKPTDFLASSLPRTVLSAAQNADEARTAVLARTEMRSWRILQLEPTALRRPDELLSPTAMDSQGNHLPATLYRLSLGPGGEKVYAELSNRLSELVADVRSLRVEKDDARRLLNLVLTDSRRVDFQASSLSDGTLRFVALGVLELDPAATGVLCLEEPENGIHPQRINAMLRLLFDMATHTGYGVGSDNPLRQVIVSTHSPVVVARVPHESLLFADHSDVSTALSGQLKALRLRPMAHTWRTRKSDQPVITKGEVLHYLGSMKDSGDDPPHENKSVYEVIAVQEKLFEDFDRWN